MNLHELERGVVVVVVVEAGGVAEVERLPFLIHRKTSR